jgi:formyl-CoA transferase
VSVYPTKDGFVYVAVGNDRQWAAITDLAPFQGLKEAGYEKNAGRIGDVSRLNQKIAGITRTLSTEEMLGMFRSITVPISKIQSIEEVAADPLVRKKLLRARDDRTGIEIALAPPPYTTDFLQECGGVLSFPPRFGEHNAHVYGQALGCGEGKLEEMKKKGII